MIYLRGLILCLTLLAACSTEADRNTMNCERVPVGASLDETLAVMGDPVFRAEPGDLADGRLILGYKSAFGASGAIEVILSNRGSSEYTVIHKWCVGTP